MALKNTMEPAAVAERLAGWLPGVLGAADGVAVTDVEIPQTSGMSSQTVLLTATWRGSGGTSRTAGLVLRVPPESGGIFDDTDIAREARVMTAVGHHTPAAVPRVLAHEDTGTVLGSPFLLLERAHGQVPGDDPPFVTGGWVTDLTDAQRARMYDGALATVAAIGGLDPSTAGLEDLGRAGEGDVLDREIAHWKRFYAWASGELSSSTVEQALEILEADRPESPGRNAVSWGDARFGNLMFGADQAVTGVFDWEMATLGPPEMDLGYFLFFDRMYSTGIGAPRLGGFPDRAAAISRYEELAGHSVNDIDWYEAWGALRGAILLVRVGVMMIDYGFLPPDAAMPVNNPASQTLAALLELPPPDGESGWITGHR